MILHLSLLPCIEGKEKPKERPRASGHLQARSRMDPQPVTDWAFLSYQGHYLLWRREIEIDR